MAYSDFTLTQLRERFGLQVASVSGSFESIASIAPSEFLKTTLERGMPVAVGRGREKARSEALVLPILLEVRALCDQKISVFSGIEFNVDRKLGLSGYCDFLLSHSALQIEVESPVISIVEAKHEDLTQGIAQCLAEMHAAQIFNEKRGDAIETLYGVITSGTAWRFLRLTGKIAQADLTEYHIREIDKILGILVSMFR
jgi:hypothetical protein